MTTHVYLDGGTKDGTTLNVTLGSDLLIQYGGNGSFLDKEETYEPTTETRTVEGVEHTVYRLA